VNSSPDRHPNPRKSQRDSLRDSCDARLGSRPVPTHGPVSGEVPTPPLLEAGRVGRPHGLDGSFHVTRPDARLLAAVEDEIFVNGRAERIERRAGTDDRPILRLAGHAGREAAEALRGARLEVPLERAPALEPGEYWAHELEGCAVVDGERRVGEVRRMLPLPSCEALEVVRADGGATLLVPMVRDAIRSVDVGGKRIDVDMAFVGE
jgi:16S rRNA processing protein RimM